MCVRAVLLSALVLTAPALPSAGWCPLSDRACGIEGLPSAVVEGIIVVESGGNPWALHVGIGKGYAFYPRSVAEARRFLAVSLALTDNVDIGLMQINWRTWRRTVRGLGLDAHDLLDAQINMEIGCRVLSHALSGRGPFLARLGRYHSRRPERARWYAQRVMAAAREIDSGGGR
ncbi:MAG: transglycosylase SLT domain-containing protein [Candidatus Tectomicrobia bacterium]|nr:transglycosylase SLT domain-containing protein [Candidatus Tectomicrobia bacterium]